MKHILNNMSEEEKNKIREQHTGGMKVMTESFSRLLNSKLGDLVKEQNHWLMTINRATRDLAGVKTICDFCKGRPDVKI
jgi:hypothetical protein